MIKPETTCLLCGVPAVVTSPVSDHGLQTDSETGCAACGPWVVSHQDHPELRKQTVETKQRIAQMVREHSKKNSDVPFLVNVGLIDYARVMGVN
jgi:hypothetical protein